MGINLSKAEAERKVIDLSKKAKSVVLNKGLESQKAYVVAVFDISGSMSSIYNSGVMQRACERLLGLAMNFDDNGAIDVFLFGSNSHYAGEVSLNNFYNFVDSFILKKYSLEGSTMYAGVMEKIIKKYGQNNSKSKGLFSKLFSKTEIKPVDTPTYVLFITDGDNFDKDKTTELVKASSNEAIYWQFVGIGNNNFNYLEKLDNLKGRDIDNTGFFQINDMDKISDEEMYDRVLSSFPSWIKDVKSNGILS